MPDAPKAAPVLPDSTASESPYLQRLRERLKDLEQKQDRIKDIKSTEGFDMDAARKLNSLRIEELKAAIKEEEANSKKGVK